jgi:predicted negative regulator of RcsB-dependent stress response
MESARRLRSWFRAPYGLLAAFLVLTLGPSLGLVWLGWRLLDQDRALQNQRIAERRERAADEVVGQRHDYNRAVRLLQPLARSPDRTIRAGALLRIARNRRKAGQPDAALRTCTELAASGGTAAGGRWARRRRRC